MNIEKEREAFEDWAYSNKWNICRYPKSDYHMKEGQYCDEFVNGAWHGWIASANRECYKLVPKYHQENIKDALIIACDIKEDEQRFEDSLNYVHEAMTGACDDH